MTDFENITWKDVLPDVYKWSEKVKPAAINDLVDGAHHIVATATKKDASGGLEIAAKGLPANVSTQLLQAAAVQGWVGKGGAAKIVLDKKTFILTPLTRIKTSTTQIGRQFGIDAAKAVKDLQCKQLVFCAVEGLQLLDIYDGFISGAYRATMFKTYKTEEKENGLPEKLHFFGDSVSGDALAKCQSLARAISLTRMLQDAPANWLHPERFGEIAIDVAKAFQFKCNLLDKKQMQDLGMGSFLSVAKGSPYEPRLICMEVKGKDPSKTIALVGKGLTFDSGGTSLKPSEGMGEMKYDMSGGAAVLGTMVHLSQVQPPVNVVGIIGAVENISGGYASRPGDIVVAMNKKSIDVQNTDAEGRLVLADLLHYANTQYRPQLMIDIATLTGAVLHALGHAGAAVMANDEKVAAQVMAAAKEAGEPFWELPMWPELDKEVKSELSDLQNIAKSNVKAGTIIGAVFLKEFVGETPWAHLDIAGTGWTCTATGFPAGGGSGYGVRTMSTICLRYK